MPKTGKNSKGNVFKKKSSAGSADFKRKTAKVGKKVERATATKISVESKQINVPLQSKISLKEPADENSVFFRTLRQLRHYSHSNRIQALVDLNNFLLTCQDPESYSSLVMPEAMELLYDDDVDVREALLGLMFTITTNVEAKIIGPIVPVLVTYICSGLTSLNKGVRRDSLVLLGQISVTEIAQLLSPFTNKILENILGMLDKASLIFHSGARIQGGISREGSTSTGAAESTLSSQGKMRGGARGPRPGEIIAAEGASRTGPESHLLVLLLRVVRGLLSNSNKERVGEGACRVKNSSLEAFCVRASASASASAVPVEMLVPFTVMKRVPLYFCSQASADSDNASTTDSVVISRSHEKVLCEQLNIVWNRLVAEGSVVKAPIVRTLHEAVGSMISLGRRPHISSSCNAFMHMVVSAFTHFPYVSYESNVSSVSQTMLDECLHMTKSLNVALCEVALLACKDAHLSAHASKGEKHTSLEDSVSHLLSVSLSFLLQCLDDLDSMMQAKARGSVGAIEVTQPVCDMGSDGSCGDKTGDDTTLEVRMDVVSRYEEPRVMDESISATRTAPSSDVDQSSRAPSKRFEKKGEAFSVATLLTYRRQEDEQTRCLFRCLKMIVLDHDIRAWYPMTLDKEGGEISFATEILRGLENLTRSIASFTVKEGSKRQHSQRDIKNVISACLECLASMCIDDQPRFDLATPDGDKAECSVLLYDIVNCLRPLLYAPSLLCLKGWPEKLREQVADMFIEALHSVVRRLPSCSIRSDEKSGDIRFLDEKTGDFLVDLGNSRRGAANVVDLGPLITCLQDSLYVSPDVDKGGFYTTCNEKQRQSLLHLFAIAPFYDFTAVVKAFAPIISRADATHLSEQTSFLNSLTRRKRDISPGNLATVLFRMLEQNNEYIRKSCCDSHHVLREAVRISGDEAWLGTSVARTLRCMSTPSKPMKIVKFLQGNIIEMLQMGARALGNSKGPVQRNWLARIYHRNAVAAIVSSLFVPCFERIGEHDEHGTVASANFEIDREIFSPILDSLAELVVCAASCELDDVFPADTLKTFCDEASQNKELFVPSSGLNSLFLAPLMRLLATKAHPAVATDLGMTTSENNQALSSSLTTSQMQLCPLLCAYLLHVHEKFTLFNTLVNQKGVYECLNGQLALVKSLERVLRHDACRPAAFQSRLFLRTLVASLQMGLIGTSAEQQEKESNVHFQIRSILRDLEEDTK